jgi:hypothetical protein
MERIVEKRKTKTNENMSIRDLCMPELVIVFWPWARADFK